MEPSGSRMSGRLAKVAKDFEAKLGADLADCLIDPKELQSLRSKASDAEDLLKKRHQLETELQSLKESNGRLSAELYARLKPAENTNQVGEDNKRLREELKVARQQLQELKESGVRAQGTASSSSTPGLADVSSSSTAESTMGKSRGASKEEYGKLTTKYNKICNMYQELSGAKKQIEEVLRQRKKELHEWQKISEQKDADIEKKRVKIQRQTEEIRKLKDRVQELERECRVSTVEVQFPDYVSVRPIDFGREIRSSQLTQPLQSHAHQFRSEDKPPDIIKTLELVPRRPALSAPPQLPDDSITGPKVNHITITGCYSRPVTSGGERNVRIQASQNEVFQIDERIRMLNDQAPATQDQVVPRSSPGSTLPPLRNRSIDFADHPSEGNIESTQFVRLEPESPHSSSTDGDTEESCSIKEGEAAYAYEVETNREARELSETLEIVSCRALRKRRVQNVAPESPTMPKIKQEVFSSSPIGIVGFRNFDFNASMDLDEIGEKIDTPKKRRRVELHRQASRLSDTESTSHNGGYQHDGMESANAVEITPKTRSTPGLRLHGQTGSVLQLLSPNQKILPRTSDGKYSNKRRREISDKSIEDVAEDGVAIQKMSGTKSKPSPQRAFELNARLGGLLDQPSPEKRVLSPSRIHNPLSPSKRGLTSKTPSALANILRADAPISAVAMCEDTPRLSHALNTTPIVGSNSGRPVSIQDIQVFMDEENPSKNKAQEKQYTLKTRNKSPLKKYTLKRKSPIRSRRGSLSQSGDLKISSEDVQVGRKPPQPGSRSKPPFPDSVGWNGLDDEPENEPFRVRPVHRLGLEHFKVNPAYNGGYEYAFTDVVRGQAERRCLQGCTKPECCGNKFRALALEMLHEPQTSSQEAEEQRLLNEYMGDNRGKLRTMTEDQKREVLLQAKTRELSNKYGKHRHAFARSKTPPGFWDADFPSTQEQVTTREQQHQHERRMVEERYQEAMRPGGRFLFRDE